MHEEVEKYKAEKEWYKEKKEYRFNFKEPGEEEVGERAVVTNSRVRLLSQLPPERKSLAWGALAFAAGLGAV